MTDCIIIDLYSFKYELRKSQDKELNLIKELTMIIGGDNLLRKKFPE